MDGGCLNFFFINPNFNIHYHRYEAPVVRDDGVDYDALYSNAFAQIGERTTITLSKGRVSCQSGMHNTRWNNNLPRIKHKKNAVTIFDAERFVNFTPISHHEIFAPIEEMKARIREAGGWDAYWAKQNRATDNFLQSAIGFEPTEHSDAPPYIPTTPTARANVCIDFGFEPTEASE